MAPYSILFLSESYQRIWADRPSLYVFSCGVISGRFRKGIGSLLALGNV